MREINRKISALIITYNEIGYIERCLESVSFADEIIVVDSYSTDGTYEYLLNHPKVKVIQNPFKDFTTQKSFALEKATNNWILFLDADEVVPKKLQNEIIATVKTDRDYAAFWFYRKFMFQKQRLYFSGWQTDKNYRLFRKDKVAFSKDRIVHETLHVNGRSGILKETLVHYCYKNYNNYKNKMLQYGRLKAKEAFNKEKRFTYLHLIIKPSWKFLFNYLFRLGVLDGKKGVIICYLGALGEIERFKELRRLEKRQKLAPYLITSYTK
ncbi:glycosyltransferase family 2 protein [Muriicola sp. Z0-33]|uniref:glycosyltransferase family 2 protein n=1 Tax=Muriicola sp. Z0-33 TaxID=2816957 RepID=UPI0022370777|nr:glycosyltransferase family 2 protein [Muriicola sp. Z0-33]MCW5515960.1 glycosyltransferase family 2 protein [Muriicola sp. Z0-33]